MFIPPTLRRTDSEQNLSKTMGFSLVELITVVAIIGILAAATIPVYQNFVGKAKIAVAKSTLDAVRFALVSQVNENQTSYPATIDFTTGLDDQGKTVFQQPLLDQIHKDLFPPSIIYTGNNNNFALTAQAMDANHTVLILTQNSLDIQGQ